MIINTLWRYVTPEDISFELVVLVHLLYYNMQKDKGKRVDEVEQEPNVNRLDVGGLGDNRREEDIKGGQHCHARDVCRHDRLKVLIAVNVHGGLVDYVHHHGGQIRGDQKTVYPPLQLDANLDNFMVGVFKFLHSHLPHLVLQ